MKSKCSASVLAVRPHHRQHSLIIRILRGCHSQNTQIGGGVAWWHLPSCRSLMFDNVFLQDGSLSLSNSYRHEIPMCHTSYTGLFYQIIIHNYSHQKHHFLHSLELSKCSPIKDTIREATTNGFPPYEDFHDLGDSCYLVPLPTPLMSGAFLRFSQLEETTQSIPGVSTRMIHRFAQSFNPSKLQKKIIPVHLTCFLFSAFKQIPEAPEPSTWRARPWVALLRTSGTIAELFLHHSNGRKPDTGYELVYWVRNDKLCFPVKS